MTMTLGSKVLPALRIALCVRCSIKPVIYMYCILSGGSYIYLGGVGLVVFTIIHSSSYKLQNNTMTIVYQKGKPHLLIH